MDVNWQMFRDPVNCSIVSNEVNVCVQYSKL
jgi:hypothetical protein